MNVWLWIYEGMLWGYDFQQPSKMTKFCTFFRLKMSLVVLLFKKLSVLSKVQPRIHPWKSHFKLMPCFGGTFFPLVDNTSSSKSRPHPMGRSLVTERQTVPRQHVWKSQIVVGVDKIPLPSGISRDKSDNNDYNVLFIFISSAARSLGLGKSHSFHTTKYKT